MAVQTIKSVSISDPQNHNEIIGNYCDVPHQSRINHPSHLAVYMHDNASTYQQGG
jgi:hypothetical protein